MKSMYKPLFPYFGGKSRIASVVWNAIGDVNNYVEPFFGSGAVLFRRPHEPRIETVNDADGFVANAWRAIKAHPDDVADYADWPVNEADLHARHVWLLGQRESLTDRLMGDPDWCDPKVAGWWIWGMSVWIGSGWCSGIGPWTSEDGRLVRKQMQGCGVNRQRPHLGDAGMGVNRKTDTGRLLEWFSARLRRVRVCCGDWTRVCGKSVTYHHGTTGVFLDPPYSKSAKRTSGLYAVDCMEVANTVREWAIKHGENDSMRIVLAGMEGEHNMPAGWREVAWKGRQGYKQSTAASRRERLWMSPHCR